MLHLDPPGHLELRVGGVGPVLVRLVPLPLHQLGDHHDHRHLGREVLGAGAATSSWMIMCQKWLIVEVLGAWLAMNFCLQSGKTIGLAFTKVEFTLPLN